MRFPGGYYHDGRDDTELETQALLGVAGPSGGPSSPVSRRRLIRATLACFSVAVLLASVTYSAPGLQAVFHTSRFVPNAHGVLQLFEDASNTKPPTRSNTSKPSTHQSSSLASMDSNTTRAISTASSNPSATTMSNATSFSKSPTATTAATSQIGNANSTGTLSAPWWEHWDPRNLVATLSSEARSVATCLQDWPKDSNVTRHPTNRSMNLTERVSLFQTCFHKMVEEHTVRGLTVPLANYQRPVPTFGSYVVSGLLVFFVVAMFALVATGVAYQCSQGQAKMALAWLPDKDEATLRGECFLQSVQPILIAGLVISASRLFGHPPPILTALLLGFPMLRIALADYQLYMRVVRTPEKLKSDSKAADDSKGQRAEQREDSKLKLLGDDISPDPDVPDQQQQQSPSSTSSASPFGKCCLNIKETVKTQLTKFRGNLEHLDIKGFKEFCLSKLDILDASSDGVALASVFLLECRDQEGRHAARISAAWGHGFASLLLPLMGQAHSLSATMLIVTLFSSLPVLGLSVLDDTDNRSLLDLAGLGLTAPHMSRNMDEEFMTMYCKIFARVVFEAAPQLWLQGTAVMTSDRGIFSQPVLAFSILLSFATGSAKLVALIKELNKSIFVPDRVCFVTLATPAIGALLFFNLAFLRPFAAGFCESHLWGLTTGCVAAPKG